jgi:hypothetical protein
MMANRAGLRHFSMLRKDTYDSITHEFIATLEDNICEASGNYWVKFSIAGERQHISLHEFCEIYFPRDGKVGSTISNALLVDAAST